jgi:hypothetical protein
MSAPEERERAVDLYYISDVLLHYIARSPADTSSCFPDVECLRFMPNEVYPRIANNTFGSSPCL